MNHKNIKEYERLIIAILWSLACIFYIGYILVVYGSRTEILTLIIGLIGGCIVGGIFGHYFSSNHKPTDQGGNELSSNKTENNGNE